MVTTVHTVTASELPSAPTIPASRAVTNPSRLSERGQAVMPWATMSLKLRTASRPTKTMGET